MLTVAGDNQQPSNEFYLNSTSMPRSYQGKEIPWTMLTGTYLSIASISTPQIKKKDAAIQENHINLEKYTSSAGVLMM